MCSERLISLRFCFQVNSGEHNRFLYISWILIQLLFYFQILHLLCADAVTLVSFPHLLNILYLMLLFILTTYVCCSNSKLNTYDHVFNCLQNNQWGGFKKPMTRSPPLFSYPFLFSFLFEICHFLRVLSSWKTRLLYYIWRPLFLYLSLERKSQMCVFSRTLN